ncbi:MAG: L,D-transpeptidase [Polyangiaceae bacterium]|nr:L,D-transpeptidase [Polyangiaceae bacterium]
MRWFLAAGFLPVAVALGLGCRGEAAPPLASSAPAPAESAAASAPSETPSAAASASDEPVFATPGSPVVDLDGKYAAPAPLGDGPKIAVTGMLVPVYAKPSSSSKKIGYLRAGAIVEADASPMGKDGCPGGWRGIKPAGFVCEGDKTTTDLEDPIVRATARRPDTSQKLPYMYGTVTRGGPVYSRIPTKEELKDTEPSFDTHIKKWKNDEVSGAGYGLDLWYKWRDKPTFTAWEAFEEHLTEEGAIPFYLKDGKSVPNLSGLAKGSALKIDQVDRRQGAAFLDSFLFEGRRYNVTTDLRVVPGDRYRPIRGSDYHGVRIGTDVEMPFALIRRKGAKKWTWSSSKDAMVEGDALDYRAAVNLTGKQKFHKGVLHFETKDGFWVDDRHASRVDPAKRMPKWGKNGEKWLDVNITKQVLVAYEGEKPVFATLVSTGEDGLLEGARATKKGIFRIHTKYVTTTMDSEAVGEEFELRDVPYVQYFEEGFALHGAYWHDVFGMPKSHGCINLAPEDARRLFHWTEPQVPPGWHGAARSLTGTVVFVHP